MPDAMLSAKGTDMSMMSRVGILHSGVDSVVSMYKLTSVLGNMIPAIKGTFPDIGKGQARVLREGDIEVCVKT